MTQRAVQVAVFIRTLHDAGGAQRAMVRYASGLAELGLNVDVLTLKAGGRFTSELHPKISVKTIGGGRLGRAIVGLAMYLRHTKPTVLFSTEPACNVAVLIAKWLSRTDVRVVIREGLFPSAAMRESPHRATRWAYRISPFVYPLADAIVAIATPMADDLARVARIPRERITTIAVNPVVTPALLNVAKQIPEHPWFANAACPVILGVGRLGKQKDFLTLIKAFSIVRAKRECKLLIIGDGPEREALEVTANDSQFAADIELPGFLQEPYSLMAHCGVFVLPSRYEGLPNVLIEALACGAPAVATDCPSGPSDILQDGNFGKLVKVGQVSEMAMAIEETLAHPVNRARQQARGLEFTVQNSLALYLPVLLPQYGLDANVQ